MPEQKTKSQIQAFYQGGTKMKANIAMTIEQFQLEMSNARKENRDAVVSSINENPQVDKETINLTRNGLLFYTCTTLKEESSIMIAPANAIPPSIVR